jgi:MoxR-like ATPase
MSSLPELQPRRSDKVRIPPQGLVGRDRKPYLPDHGLLVAANTAIALGRPLLLTGEPGCGKTDFAWAVAQHLDGRRTGPRQGLCECHVRSDTRARDLLYHYDALRRFGDAQHGDQQAKRAAEDPRNYVELQPLGLALVAPIRQVVLIDEIDKAPRDLPNDLLRELERGEFEIPEIPVLLADDAVTTRFAPWGEKGQQPLRRQMKPPVGEERRPIIIITSNVERQLPDAFLRRCVFYHIRFPDKDRLSEILRKRRADTAARVDVSAQARDDAYIDCVVSLFLALRTHAGLHKKPSTAELLDWTGGLDEAYAFDGVFARIGALAGALDTKTAKFTNYTWHDVPGLSCLLKLREDLDALGER